MNSEFNQSCGNITLALDNTAEYEDWLIVQSYIDMYKEALVDIREYIHSEEFFMLMNSGSIINCPPDKSHGEDYFKAQGKLDKIIFKVLGDE